MSDIGKIEKLDREVVRLNNRACEERVQYQALRIKELEREVSRLNLTQEKYRDICNQYLMHRGKALCDDLF